jgi:hypothetical protein
MPDSDECHSCQRLVPSDWASAKFLDCLFFPQAPRVGHRAGMPGCQQRSYRCSAAAGDEPRCGSRSRPGFLADHASVLRRGTVILHHQQGAARNRLPGCQRQIGHHHHNRRSVAALARGHDAAFSGKHRTTTLYRRTCSGERPLSAGGVITVVAKSPAIMISMNSISSASQGITGSFWRSPRRCAVSQAPPDQWLAGARADALRARPQGRRLGRALWRPIGAPRRK